MDMEVTKYSFRSSYLLQFWAIKHTNMTHIYLPLDQSHLEGCTEL